MNTNKQSKMPVGESFQTFKKKVAVETQFNYLLYLPADYATSSKKYPLIFFLHGAGERGPDINRVKIHGPIKYAETHKDFPFIIVAPQCPADNWWADYLTELNGFLDGVLGEYRVDKQRIYLTGLSMGGEGAWKLAMKYPDRFAALIPVCGIGRRWSAMKIKNMPIWVFHGAKDETIPISESDKMVKALQDLHADVKYTVYPDAGHDSWTATYNNPEIYEWLLQHKKPAK